MGCFSLELLFLGLSVANYSKYQEKQMLDELTAEKVLSYKVLPESEIAKVSAERLLDLIFDYLLTYQCEAGDSKNLADLIYACKHFKWEDTYIGLLSYDAQTPHLVKNALVNFAMAKDISIPINSLNDLRDSNGEIIKSHRWSGYLAEYKLNLEH
jgi:hypothetical protein